ncbi:MAG: CD3324 family protein [Defluviitaleaceae bacterium]|nr:CD3324 family protein [Defluviitaleaceae bacterium]
MKMLDLSRTTHQPSHTGRYYSLKYVNAREVLPPDILAQVQKYTCGALIYVPKKDDEKIAWGQLSGARAQVYLRNTNIMEAYKNGTTISDLMEEYCLSEASIRKIIYKKERPWGRCSPTAQ